MTPIASSPTAKNITTYSSAPRSRGHRRRSWSAEQKADCLTQFAASGLTAKEFCRNLGLSTATFSQWRNRHRGRSPATGRGGFAEVRIGTPAPGTPGGAVTIQLPKGINLAATPGTDPIWLGRLIQALG